MKKYLLLGFLILASAVCASAQTGGDIEARTADGRTVILKSDGTWAFKQYAKMGVTAAAFKTLTDGMLYSDVVAVLGGEGKLQSESTIADITTRMYEWKTASGSMTAMFQNDKLESKWQYGLK